MKTGCIGADVGGFSNVLPTLFTEAENETITIMAVNITSDWMHTLLAEYDTAYPTGSGEHTVDVLHYLGTTTLQPSSYAWLGISYMSYISLTIQSDETVSFVSCHPDKSTVFMNPGWFVPVESGESIGGTLYFGSSIPEWSVIDFTFEGNTIPEYSPVSAMLLIAFASATVLCLRKRVRTAT